jgi:hypothetical protein
VTLRRHLRHPIALLALGLLVACAAKGDGTQEQLGRGCQFMKCVCTKPRESIMPTFTKVEPGEVLWREDGSAYCPEGTKLERREARSIYDRPMY